jgi:hypothetical protein
MQNAYQHTQPGYLVIISVLAVIILTSVLLAVAGFSWIAFAVILFLIVILALFSSLTVVIQDDLLEVRFGPGVIRKTFKLSDIESSQVVKNPWYYGWGLRGTPHGRLYNVSGLYAVEIKLRNGTEVRIGSDQPQELNRAIEHNIS